MRRLVRTGIASLLMLISACTGGGEYPVSSIKLKPSSIEARTVGETIAAILESNRYQKIRNHPLEGRRAYLPGEGDVEVFGAYSASDGIQVIITRPLDLVGGALSITSGRTNLKDAQYALSQDVQFSVVMTETDRRGEPFSSTARVAFQNLIKELQSAFGEKQVLVPANWGEAVMFHMKDGQILRQ